MSTKRKNTSGYSAIIAAFCIIVYIFAIAQAIVRLYLSVEQRKLTAEKEFSSIAFLAQTAGSQGFMNDQFIETMNKSLAINRSIEALIISSPQGEYAFERQKGYAVTWVNNSPRFINRFSFSSQNHLKSLQINDLRNVNIRAVSGIFDYIEITRILKETLLLILGGFAVAFFTMLLQLLVGKPEEKIRTVNFKPPSPTEQPIFKEEKQFENKPLEVKEEPVVTRNIIEPAAVNNIKPEDEGEPKGLYSPRSNIGWEEYIKDRLDSEIHRCASTEKDITVVLMEFMDITNDNMYKQAAEEAISFFSSRDLLFEYDKTGILAILPGIDLDTGISKSEKFYGRILEKFPNSKKSRSSVCMGLSSRSGRLLDADRLMIETKEALRKAKHDQKSPIIAFKSDPEKYRVFIASQNSEHL